MNTTFWNKNWREYAPKSLKWLQNTKVTLKGSSDHAAIRVAFVSGSKEEQAWTIESKHLSLQTKESIKKQALKLGWKTKGSCSVVVGDAAYLLIALTELDVSLSQKGRQAGLEASSYLASRNFESVAFLASEKIETLDVIDGFFQGMYSLQSFKGQTEEKAKAAASSDGPGEIVLDDAALTEAHIEKAKRFAEALTITRWLEDAPPNWLTPERFAQIASDLSAENGLTCTVHGREGIEKLGFGCFASVACGSKLDPKFIVIEVPGQDSSKSIALVGKGLTFDSGGISLKPSEGMGEMKYDMCGAAGVLGSAYYMAKVKPKTKVFCMIGSVENMPGEMATRPSDIVTAYNKKTVEILNTDAEGRLVLCDILAYASQTYKPELIVDIATLTGAVLVALGSCGSAVLSNKQSAADYVLKVSRKVGEPVWQLPLWPEIAKEIRSEVADYKNIASGSVKAGTIVAAQFLKEFVGTSNWVHLDIAGTGSGCKATGYPTSGGSGFGLRLLSEICLQYEPGSLV